MTDAIRHYLLFFDSAAGRLVRIDEFDDPDAAVSAYDAAEREASVDPKLEIVLLGTDSLETLKKTHGRYFTNGTSLAKLAGISVA